MKDGRLEINKAERTIEIFTPRKMVQTNRYRGYMDVARGFASSNVG
jgi:hypothetical protein